MGGEGRGGEERPALICSIIDPFTKSIPRDTIFVVVYL